MSKQQTPEKDERTFTEELEVAGSQLVDRVQELIKEGNVRRLIIRSADDNVLLETSLTVGATVAGFFTLAALPLAVVAAIAAAVARVKIEIVREIDKGDEGKQKIEIDEGK